MNLMECRLVSLKNLFEGFLKTGKYLIEFDGTQFSPFFINDDIGIYVIIPKLAQLFGLHIETAINIFFFTILLFPAFIGLAGLFYYFEGYIQKLIALIGVCLLTRIVYGVGDLYLAYFACVISIIPWALYFAKYNQYSHRYLFFMFCAGLTIGFFHFLRIYSGLGVLFFMIVIFFMRFRYTQKEAIGLWCILLFGMLLPKIYFNNVYSKFIEYTKSNSGLSAKLNDQESHVFWHTLYIGFGFLKYGNPDDIEYDDNYGYKKAKQIDPSLKNLQTKKYESILKEEVMLLIKKHKNFVIFTLFAKIGILLLYLLKYANFGLIAAIFYRKPWWQEIPFLIGTGFYALFPLIAVPTPLEYSLGFISFTVLYGIVSINFALEKILANKK